MALPLTYVARNLWVRRLTTALTAAGMALVVFVFAAVLMLDAGLKATMVATGSADNVVFISKGSQTEIQSGFGLEHAGLISVLPQIARDARGVPLASGEIVVLNSLPKSDTGQPSNVPVRGMAPVGLVLRPQVRFVAGRAFRPGSSEIVVGRSVAREFAGVEIGHSLRFALRQWTVVGVFDAGGTGFDSEIWGDFDQLRQAFRRETYVSSVVAKLARRDAFDALVDALAAEPRLKVEVKRERDYYEDQTRQLSTFIGTLGLTLSAIFSLGAMIGAAITMYASVANRTAEIGTLRALGFRRRSILGAFLLEALLLALAGGIAGLAAASGLQAITISTTNFQSFSELAFSLAMTPRVVVESLLFAVVMGFVGGVLPAFKAARMRIVDALRAD
ncbi:MAG TPA: ABC transporter permease [Burkholderiaceae bacterium]